MEHDASVANFRSVLAQELDEYRRNPDGSIIQGEVIQAGF